MLIEKIKSRLVPDAARAHKFWSMRLATLLTLLIAFKDEVVPLLQGAISEQAWKWILASLSASIILARVYKQNNLDSPDQAEQGEGAQ